MRKLLKDEKNTRLLFCRKPATRAKQNVRICAKIAVKKRSFVVDKKKKLKRTMKSPEMAHSLTPPVLVFKPIFRAVFFCCCTRPSDETGSTYRSPVLQAKPSTWIGRNFGNFVCSDQEQLTIVGRAVKFGIVWVLRFRWYWSRSCCKAANFCVDHVRWWSGGFAYQLTANNSSDKSFDLASLMWFCGTFGPRWAVVALT